MKLFTPTIPCRCHVLLRLPEETLGDHICRDLPQVAEIAYSFVLLLNMSYDLNIILQIIAFIGAIFQSTMSLWHCFCHKP
jgi:hypothetical protein